MLILPSILVAYFAKPLLGRSDCGRGRVRCPNSDICIQKQFMCDGEYDCNPLSDWDERNCTGNISCDLGQFKCGSTQTCIPSSYVCDGDEDCADNSDELNCEE